MAIIFPKHDNPQWPLPGDYPDLTSEGRSMARKNAVSIGGTPDYEVAGWNFMREYYLRPLPQGAWYKHGFVKSPDSHFQLVRDWHSDPLTVTAAPRSFAKSTLVREQILRELLRAKFREEVVFMAKESFVIDMMDLLMWQITDNEMILEDFGKLKPPKGQGSWNHHKLNLLNKCGVTGMSIGGASLGKRPHRIWLDDVEKDESLIISPADTIEGFRNFMLNVVYPMAEEGCSMHVIGTLLSRRTFIYWMQTTQDPRIQNFLRTLLAVQMKDADGNDVTLWEEKMGKEWQARQMLIMGEANFRTQYMNDPGTEEERTLQVHSELCTYRTDDHDTAFEADPLDSKAVVKTHKVIRIDKDEKTGTPTPIIREVIRPFGEVAASLQRFITVDYATTTNESSDFSVVHSMGFENSEEFRSTLWSLDVEMGKWPREVLVQKIYQMARKWQVSFIGVEAYPLQMEWYERIRDDLPALYGPGDFVPRMIPLKFPPSVTKAQKIQGLEWRFKQYRIKIPIDRTENPGYNALWHQIANFTPDMTLLRHDDVIDSLAMHQAIGKQARASGPDVERVKSAIELLEEGTFTYEESGIPVLSGMNASDIPDDVLRKMLNQNREIQEEAHASDTYANISWSDDYVNDFMGGM